MLILTLMFLTVLIYGYVIYPLTLLFLTRKSAGDHISKPDTDLPVISVIVPVHNAEAMVELCVRNCLSLDYPEDRLQLIFVSDASSDRTEAIIEKFPRVQLLVLPERSGKERCLEAGIRCADGEIICFADVCASVPEYSLKTAAAYFADSTVGVVSSRDDLDSPRYAFDKLHVEFEMFIRRRESCLASSVGASGSFFAARKSLALNLTHKTCCSDLEIALLAVKNGLRVVQDESLRVRYSKTASVPCELSRQVRIITHGMNTIASNPGILNPFKYGLFSWQVFSHKIIRWMVPMLALAWLAGAVLTYRDYFDIQHIVAASIAVGALLVFDRWCMKESLIRACAKNTLLPLVYVSSVLLALVRIVSRHDSRVWLPTQRNS